MDKIYEQQFRKERKEEEEKEGGESTWGYLARPDGAGSSKTKQKKGPPARQYPDPPFTLRKMTGSTGRTSYELSQKLDALRYSRQKHTDGGEVGRRGSGKGARYRPENPSGLGT